MHIRLGTDDVRFYLKAMGQFSYSPNLSNEGLGTLLLQDKKSFIDTLIRVPPLAPEIEKNGEVILP